MIFSNFGLNLFFFSKKNAFTSSKKPLGKRRFSLSNIFNNRSHEIYRKLDKKHLKFLLFLGSFWGLWSQPKKSKNFFKYIPDDTNFTSVGFYG